MRLFAELNTFQALGLDLFKQNTDLTLKATFLQRKPGPFKLRG